MAEVPVTIVGMIYPRDKSLEPYPATIVGFASISGLGVGGGPILPPDEVPKPEPPLTIWGGPFDPPHPAHPIVLPDPITPPITPPSAPEKPHEGWNWKPSTPDNPRSGWYYLYVPQPGTAQPKR